MEDILSGLNDAQKAAVTSQAKVLQVLAPPGSGKTKTLTARVAYLIKHDAYSFKPSDVVVCTFTVKAAREMSDRISAFLGNDVASRLILGTFHSIARRYLAVYGHHIGLKEQFSIADTSDTLSILTRIIKRRKLSTEAKIARSRISALKSQGVSAEQFMTSSRKAEQQEIALIYTDYEEHLLLSSLLDFDDLLLRCTELLRAWPSCVSNIQAVLVDEFQDTNNTQYELMSLFAQHNQNITIVGDPDQSIYGWRNAEMRNLKRMQAQYSDTHVAKLEENYRSSGAILITAQEIIEQDESRPAKKLMPTHSVGMQPVLRKLPNSAVEARWIVSEMQRIAALTGYILDWSDFVVLLRSASLSRHIESELGKSGIPYRMVGGHKFFDRLEIRLVLDYLRVISHPDHNDALARVINVPSRRIGDATIHRLLTEATSRKQTLWKIVLGLVQGEIRFEPTLSSRAQKGLDLFVNLVLSARRRVRYNKEGDISLTELMTYIVKKIKLEDHLHRTKPEDHETRWANVQELISQANEFSLTLMQENPPQIDPDVFNELQAHEHAATGTLDEILSQFLANVALASDAQKVDENSQSAKQVTLSTIHAAKGLEWPVVFIASAYSGSIPHSRAEDTDEERRLLYVAMTRAQCLLYLSYPLEDTMGNSTKLSPFLSPRSVATYFRIAGPDFDYGVVKEFAVILRRQTPERKLVETALISYDKPKDNSWLTHHQDTSGDDFPGYIACIEGPQAQQQRHSGHGAYGNAQKLQGANGFRSAHSITTDTSMQQRQSYTICKEPLSTVFVSASTALVAAKVQPLMTGRTVISRSSEQATKSKKRKLGEASTDCNSVLAYFKRRDPSHENSQTIVAAEEAELADSQLKRKSPLMDITNRNEPIDPKASVKHAVTDRISQCKPAATFHKPLIGDTTTASLTRKTLGVRRSLNGGWSARKNP